MCTHECERLQRWRGTEPRRFLHGAIRSRLFTSQSTQTRADPTTEEQSAEEIKKEVRQHSVNICAPSLPHIIPLMLGLTVQCGKCPHSQMPSPVPPVQRATKNTASIKQRRHCLRECNLWLYLPFKRRFFFLQKFRHIYIYIYKTSLLQPFHF